MLKKNLLILFCALSGVSFADMPMTSHVQESQDRSTVTTQDGKEFRVPDSLLRLSGTLKNLMQDADTVKDAIPLPNISSQTWQCIQGQFERIYNLTVEAEQNIKTDLEMLAGSDLMEVIIAANYLDIPDLLRLAVDVAKKMGTEKFKEIAFEQIATLPKQICNPIIFGQMIRVLGPVPGIQRAICNGHINSVSSVCISQDGNTIVSGSRDGTVRIWNEDGTERAICNGHTGYVRSVCISQDGNTVVSGSDDGTVRIWNMNGTERAICNGHRNWVTSVGISQDGNTIVSGSGDGTVRIWNVDGIERAICNGHRNWVTSVGISQDGNTIVSGSDDGTVRIWNVDGTEHAICNGHTGYVRSVCISQDGNTIISGSGDGTVRIWNVDGTERAICNGYTGYIHSVCVTQDGNTLVSGSVDGTVRIWNMDGIEHTICNGHIDWVSSVCISQDGTMIVSGSGGDDTVRIWDISLFNRILFMNAQQAQAVWDYLQGEHKEGWQGIQEILNSSSLIKQTALMIGAGAALALAGVFVYKSFANNSNE